MQSLKSSVYEGRWSKKEFKQSSWFFWVHVSSSQICKLGFVKTKVKIKQNQIYFAIFEFVAVKTKQIVISIDR